MYRESFKKERIRNKTAKKRMATVAQPGGATDL